MSAFSSACAREYTHSSMFPEQTGPGPSRRRRNMGNQSVGHSFNRHLLITLHMANSALIVGIHEPPEHQACGNPGPLRSSTGTALCWSWVRGLARGYCERKPPAGTVCPCPSATWAGGTEGQGSTSRRADFISGSFGCSSAYLQQLG